MPTSVITACHNSALVKQQDIGWTSKVKFLQGLRLSPSCPDKVWCLTSPLSHYHLGQSVPSYFCIFMKHLGILAHTVAIGKLTLRRLMSYIYGTPILDVSRSHTTTQHSR